MSEDADEVNHADQARRGAEDGIRTRDPLLGKELGVSAVPQADGDEFAVIGSTTLGDWLLVTRIGIEPITY